MKPVKAFVCNKENRYFSARLKQRFFGALSRNPGSGAIE
jgi:hypothetical protein